MIDAVSPQIDSCFFSGRWDHRAPDRAITVNTGSYVRVRFEGKSISAHFDLRNYDAEVPSIAWQIDFGNWQEKDIAAIVQLDAHLKQGEHTVNLMVRGLDEHLSRWTPPLISHVTFLGFTLGPGEKFLPPLPAWTHPKLKIEFLGDSITEGVLVQPYVPRKVPSLAANASEADKQAWARAVDELRVNAYRQNWSWQTDALHSWACATAQQLGAEWRQVGFGATGLVHGGSGGAPGALESFNFFYAGCPRDDWQARSCRHQPGH